MRLGLRGDRHRHQPRGLVHPQVTLEYPQKLAGQKRPLPAFILKNREFMEAFLKAQGFSKSEIPKNTSARPRRRKRRIKPRFFGVGVDADLAWHVRAWGQWVLAQARKELARFYPVYADFEPLDTRVKTHERQPMRLIPLKEDGTPDMTALNGGVLGRISGRQAEPALGGEARRRLPLGADGDVQELPGDDSAAQDALVVQEGQEARAADDGAESDKTGVVFDIERDVPVKGSNTAQKREHDKTLGAGP